MRSRRQGTSIRKGGQPTHGKIAPEAIIALRKAGFSITRIAADLSLSVSTVKYHVRRDEGREPRPIRQAATVPAPDQRSRAQSASRISQNLRLLQGIHNLSGAHAARLLGVSVQSYSDWINARQEPGMMSARRISTLFGVPLGLLIDGDRNELARIYFSQDHYGATESRIAAESDGERPPRT